MCAAHPALESRGWAREAKASGLGSLGRRTRALAKKDNDQRRHQRYDVCGVRANLMLPLDVRVVDMSLTGLRIESPLALGTGGRYNLTLRREHEMIQLHTDLQWCRLARTEPDAMAEPAPVYEIGFDFSEELSQKARELLGFLQHNVVIELERRDAFGYCRLAREDPEDARYQEFMVKQLSFSGMLIETCLLPEVDADYEMELHLDHLELSTLGKVIHAKSVVREGEESVFEAGVAFLDLEPEAQQALEEMVANFLE